MPLLLGLTAAAHAADIHSLTVTRDGARYRVEMEVQLQAPAAAAYGVFATPGLLPRINPAVQQVQVLERPSGEQARIYTEVRVCAMLYCKHLRQVQDMRYAPRPDGGDLHAQVLPALSDFSYGRADWSFRPAPSAANTLLHFSAELEPAFWIPPLIGPWLVQRSLREEALRTSAGIEQLAHPAGPPAPPTPQRPQAAPSPHVRGGPSRQLASEARWRVGRAVQDALPSFQAKQEAQHRKRAGVRGAHSLERRHINLRRHPLAP